ncbi:MAG TPA: hypothetical protein VFT76_01980 [Actinomycetota bacterium]|nr:hypothetical protein [Actinomycetota bacterium]
MTGADLAEWEAFEAAYGPILLHERLDWMRAILAYVTAKAGGDRGHDLEDFLPAWDAALELRLDVRERERRARGDLD